MKKLVDSINSVMTDLGAVEKTGKNDFQNYAYMAHAHLMTKLHPLLIKHKLAILPKGMKVISATSETFRVGTKETHQNRVVIEATYSITDGESTLEFSGVGEGVDSQDKASYKAQTGAHKYALKGLFCIPDELDAEDSKFEPGTSAAENGQKPDANDTLKAGIDRSKQIEGFIKKSLLSAAEVKADMTRTKSKSVKDLPRNVAESLINMALDRQLAAQEKPNE